MRKVYKTVLSLVTAGAFAVLPTHAQQNEDEWYNPGDWFDGNNYDYDDSTGLDYSYHDDEIGTDAWTESSEYNDYNWLGEDYEWSNNDEWGYDGYDYGADENWEANDDWGYDGEYGVGSAGTYDEGYDWGFNRGYGTQSSWKQSSGGMSGSESARGSSSAQQRSKGKQTTIRGTVERTRTMDLTDSQSKRTKARIAQVEMQNGRDVLVAVKQGGNQQARFSAGDQIQARGEIARVDGRRVLMADTIQSNGRTYDVRKVSAQQLKQEDLKPERGRVEGSRRMRSDDGEHTLLFIRFENGRTAIVDLGPQGGY